MKVLHVLEELRPSGAEVMLRVAAPHWEPLGIQADILSKGQNVGAYAPDLKQAGYGIHNVPVHPPLRFLFRYYKLLREQAYEAVHIHTEHANFWLAALAILAGVPRIVRTSHNVFAFKGRTRLERIIQRRVLRRLGIKHVSIGPSVEEAERVYFNNDTELIYNWYDDTHFVPATIEQRQAARQQLGVEATDFVVITIGNCSPVKNHTALLEALAQVASQLPFVYIHVGEEGPEKHECRLAEQLGIHERVRFAGFVRDILPLLHAADVFVMPSLYEGYGMSAIEAMGAAVPVLLADVPGLQDMKRLSDCITWVKPEPASIAWSLLAMANLSVAERTRIGRKLHQSVRAALCLERSVRAYAALYGKQ